MEQLSTFQHNDPRKLYELAQRLNGDKFFETFLTESQYQVFNYILQSKNPELFRHFLESNCTVVMPKDSEEEEGGNRIDREGKDDDGMEIDGNDEMEIDADDPKIKVEDKREDENGQKESEIEKAAPTEEPVHTEPEINTKPTDSPQEANKDEDETSSEHDKRMEAPFEEGSRMIRSLSLHVRYLLWEKAIDYFYGQDSEEVATHIESLEKEEEKEEPKVEVRDEEDDYDEEEEAVEEDKKEEVDEGLVFNENKEVVLEVPMKIFTKVKAVVPKKEAEDRHEYDGIAQEDQERLLRESNKVYHNFEHDRETLIKRRKLEKSDMRLEKKEEEETSDEPVIMNLGVASTSLQRLLNTIQHKREEVPLNDHELRTLFMDVRKNRGKWASDERIGQEELYEACEKVLVELRGYTEHSTPFLNKVSKREAPNYGLIIKKPMDLNMVMKKLKGLQYDSKQEFVDDLNLIWSNCLTYNADPKHFIRVHAVAMQKKTAKLVPQIPDIVVRNRSDVEKEEEDDRQATPQASGKGKRARHNNVKVEVDQASVEVPAVVEPEKPAVQEPSILEASDEEEEEEEEPSVPFETDDPELQTWRTLTAKSRANYCTQRAELFDEHYHLRPNAHAILRKRNGMHNFNQYLENVQVVSKSTSLLENYEPYLLEYDVTGGIPGIVHRGVDEQEQEKHEKELAEALLASRDDKTSSGFVLPTDSGLNKIYVDNIAEIQEIRRICFKISLIRQMQTQQFVHHTQMRQPEVEPVREVDVDPVSMLPSRDPCSRHVQFAVLRRNVSKIAMQTGFETAQPFAINTLTQLAERYLGNLVRSLKLHVETPSENRLAPRDALLVSLLENGVNKPDDLFTFIKEKVLKQHEKLVKLHANLANFLRDLLRPGLDSFNERNFDDNSEQFMTGDFSNDLGDDFFGFKQLGLDKEYNMMSSSIPIYLLHSRLHSSYASVGSTSKMHKHEDLKNYFPHRLVASDTDKQIGLLRGFYEGLIEKTKAHYVKNQKKKGESTEIPPDDELLLVEDDELPQKQRNVRPRLPPTGRIGGVKKKPVVGGFFIRDRESTSNAVATP